MRRHFLRGDDGVALTSGRHLPNITLPGIWGAEGLSPQQRDALWCLIDTGVVHRIHRETMQTRMVWTGGAFTALSAVAAVGSSRLLG